MQTLKERLVATRQALINVKKAMYNEKAENTTSGYQKDFEKKITPFNAKQTKVEKKLKAIENGESEKPKGTPEEILKAANDKVESTKKAYDNAVKKLDAVKKGEAVMDVEDEIQAILDEYAPVTNGENTESILDKA